MTLCVARSTINLTGAGYFAVASQYFGGYTSIKRTIHKFVIMCVHHRSHSFLNIATSLVPAILNLRACHVMGF